MRGFQSGQACLILVATVLCALPVFAWFAYGEHGLVGVVAACVAAALCGGAGVVALLMVGATAGTPGAVQGLLLGMLLRTGVPLGAGFLLMQVGGALADAGVFGLVLIYYLLTLVVETFLSTRLVHASRSKVA